MLREIIDDLGRRRTLSELPLAFEIDVRDQVYELFVLAERDHRLGVEPPAFSPARRLAASSASPTITSASCTAALAFEFRKLGTESCPRKSFFKVL